jgi:hypothetical protein
MFECDDPHTENPLEFVLVGAKPPWNQPHVTLLAFMRLPIFCPVIENVDPDEQSSNAGSASLISPIDNYAAQVVRDRASSLARDQVQCAGSRGSELSVVEVITH